MLREYAALHPTSDRPPGRRRRIRCNGNASRALGRARSPPLRGLPDGLLFWAGLALVSFAATVAWVGTRADRPEGAAWTIARVAFGWGVRTWDFSSSCRPRPACLAMRWS